LMRMLARHTLETDRWSEFDHGILADADRRHAALKLAAGVSAAYTGKLDVAEIALTDIRDARQRLEGSASTVWRARIVAVEEKELEAALTLARGDDDAAEVFLLKASALEAELNAPSGPPSPMKPAYEMYGEFLLARGRMEEAAVQISKALERTPNRTRLVRGLKHARRHASNVGLPMKWRRDFACSSLFDLVPDPQPRRCAHEGLTRSFIQRDARPAVAGLDFRLQPTRSVEGVRSCGAARCLNLPDDGVDSRLGPCHMFEKGHIDRHAELTVGPGNRTVDHVARLRAVAGTRQERRRHAHAYGEPQPLEYANRLDQSLQGGSRVGRPSV